MVSRRFGLVLIAGLAAAGCPEEHANKPKASGVDGAMSLPDLTDSDSQKLCEWLDTMSPSKTDACTYGAVVLSQDKADCETTRDACLENWDNVEAEEDDCPSPEDWPAGCQASVSEFERCMTDLLARNMELYPGLSCDDTDRAESLLERAQEVPVSCQTLERECPGLLDGESGGMPAPSDQGPRLEQLLSEMATVLREHKDRICDCFMSACALPDDSAVKACEADAYRLDPATSAPWLECLAEAGLGASGECLQEMQCQDYADCITADQEAIPTCPGLSDTVSGALEACRRDNT